MEDLLTVRHLSKHFPVYGRMFSRAPVAWIKAVDSVSFAVPRGETLGVVGETGCGKTTTGRAILRLVEPTAGEVLFRGRDILRLPPREMRALRRKMQLIFQDPYSSLNPRLTAREIIAEPLVVHGLAAGPDRARRVKRLMEMVGLPSHHGGHYPHQFSGGERQRIGLARALAVEPELIVCDEPVSALDVSIQAQVLNLFMDLQRELGLTYVFISHDLRVVKHVSDRVAVMYLGRVVETAPAGELYRSPRHPYTQALLSAVPLPDPRLRRARIILEGDVPGAMRIPPGCAFHPRCPLARPRCREEVPPLTEAGDGHLVACLLEGKRAGQPAEVTV